MPVVPRTDIFDDLEYQGGGDGSQEVAATETRDFSVAGQAYRTYLSDDNAKAFDEAMAPWTQYAEKVANPTRTRAPRAPGGAGATSGGPRKDRTQTADIRAWAQGQSFEPPVSDRGRIPDHVTDAYYAAHPEKRPAA